MRRLLQKTGFWRQAGRRATGLSLALLGLASGARSQDAPAVRPPLLLKVVPQYVVVSGFWLEVERSRPRHPGQSFILTPQLYAGAAGHPDKATIYQPIYTAVPVESGRTVRGAGLQVLHRLYREPGAAAYPTGLYASYGLSFQHFVVAYEGLGWVEVPDASGLPYLELRAGRHAETTNRYGATGQVGYQVPLAAGRVFLDVYAGLGWRTGQSRSELGAVESQYRTGPSDYGHLGWYFPAGFKIGVAVGK